MNVVITGASKGIGKAIAEKFAAEGHQIALCARGADSLNELKKELTTNYGVKVLSLQADMSKREDIQKFADAVLETFDSIDILVNNAGVFIPGKIHEEAEGNLERLIETNLYSAYYMSKAIIPGMKKRMRGQIFNICSIASFKAWPEGGSYAISKFALLGLSKSLREELKEFGIRVCSVMPGATFTDSWAGVNIDEDRFMPCEDVAEMIYASSQLSSRSVVEDIIIRPQLGDL